MNAIEMIQRCARHGSPRGLGLSWHEAGRRHDELECRQMGDKTQERATQTPNLLVWSGRAHLLAIEIKEDECALLEEAARGSSPRPGMVASITASSGSGPGGLPRPSEGGDVHWGRLARSSLIADIKGKREHDAPS